METASEIYMTYVRSNLWLVFIAGLAWIVMRPAERKEPYKSAYERVFVKKWSWNWKDQVDYQRSSAVLMAPILIWLVVFGFGAVALDMIFGID